jgi:hypothetical protein
VSHDPAHVICGCGTRVESADNLLAALNEHADEHHGGDPMYSNMQLEADTERSSEGSREASPRTVRLRGGPRDGEVDTIDALPAVIGTGAEGGVYQRAEEGRDGLTAYAWQPLTESERGVPGDLRANQEPGQ